MSEWGQVFTEQAGSSMAVYETVMVPRLFTPWAELLCDRLALQPGERVLDVACGPGTVARVAARRVGAGGEVVGCDPSVEMLAQGRDRPVEPGAAAIRLKQAPATGMPLPDAWADAITCQQGLQFVADRAAAVAELRRLVAPHGRVGIAVWTALDRSPLFHALRDAIAEVLGEPAADGYASGPWGFPDPDALSRALIDGGFADVTVEPHRLPVTFEGGAEQLVATLAVTPLAPRLADGETARRLVATVSARLGAGAITEETESSLALARPSPSDQESSA